jgi:anti-anti-sigma factor
VDTNLETVGDVAVVEILGETIDTANAADVQGQLCELATRHPKLLVDLNRVNFLDSAGCGALVASRTRCKGQGGDLRLCSPKPNVKTLLELVRLTRVLSVYDTREQALAAFAAG